MTAHLLPTRDEQARSLTEEIIGKALNSPGPKEVSIVARNNHSGDPSLYIYILMPDETQIPEIDAQNRLSGRLLTALQQIGDERFPYVSYGPRNTSVSLGPEGKSS